MVLVLPWLIGAGLVGIASAWIFSESEEDKQKREKKEADQQKQREIRNLGANEIWKSIEKLGELLIFKGENIDIEWEKHRNILFQHKNNLSTGQKLNGAELGVKERLGRSNEKAA